MTTLWVVIFGFAFTSGGAKAAAGVPHMQPIATYASQAQCKSAAESLYHALHSPGAGLAADVFCIPTGMTDPLSQLPSLHSSS